MPFTPTKCLSVYLYNTSVNANWPLDDGWQGYPYRWNADLSVTPQGHGSQYTREPYYYNGVDVKVGDHVATCGQGRILKIYSISAQNAGNVTCILEDYNRENIMMDFNSSGDGSIPEGDGMLFEVVDGLPVLHPLPDALPTSIPPYFIADITCRFLNDKEFKEIYVDQVNHGFAVGAALYLDATGWHQATAADAIEGRVMGIVTQVGVPGPDRFRFKPNGGVPVSGVSMPVGANGSTVYLDDDGSYTMTPPATGIVVPIFIKLSSTSGIYIGGQNVGPVKASDVSYDNTTAGIPNDPNTVQQAIDELAKGIAGKIDGIPFSEGTNGPPMVAVDTTSINLNDVAAFERSVIQDVVFRIPSGFDNGVVMTARHLINGAASSANVKLRLEYRVVDPGGDPNGGTLYTQNLSLTPPAAQDTVTATDIFTIPGSQITNNNSWISCRLTRRGTDGDDGYPGEWCLLSLTLSK